MNRNIMVSYDDRKKQNNCKLSHNNSFFMPFKTQSEMNIKTGKMNRNIMVSYDDRKKQNSCKCFQDFEPCDIPKSPQPRLTIIWNETGPKHKVQLIEIYETHSEAILSNQMILEDSCVDQYKSEIKKSVKEVVFGSQTANKLSDNQIQLKKCAQAMMVQLKAEEPDTRRPMPVVLKEVIKS